MQLNLQHPVLLHLMISIYPFRFLRTLHTNYPNASRTLCFLNILSFPFHYSFWTMYCLSESTCIFLFIGKYFRLKQKYIDFFKLLSIFHVLICCNFSPKYLQLKVSLKNV